MNEIRTVSQEIAINYFLQYAYKPKFNKLTRTYNGGCPLCLEGKSLGKKSRCYYVLDTDVIYCHNCQWSSKPYKWICEVTGQTPEELDTSNIEIIVNKAHISNINKLQDLQLPSLPGDCINLYNQSQLQYYSDNKQVKDAVRYARKRLLYHAINKPKSLWYCLKDDFTHQNRLILPFYDLNNNIIFYQSRRITDDNTISYLGKTNGNRSIFNIDKVNDDLDQIFVFEGPIDSCFVKNGVALAGIGITKKSLFTPLQQNQLLPFFDKKIIWVLDNQHIDSTARKASIQLLKRNESVFLWPTNNYKDFNEMCCKQKITQVSPDWILKNTYSGQSGLLQFTLKLPT